MAVASESFEAFKIKDQYVKSKDHSQPWTPVPACIRGRRSRRRTASCPCTAACVGCRPGIFIYLILLYVFSALLYLRAFLKAFLASTLTKTVRYNCWMPSWISRDNDIDTVIFDLELLRCLAHATATPNVEVVVSENGREGEHKRLGKKSRKCHRFLDNGFCILNTCTAACAEFRPGFFINIILLHIIQGGLARSMV